MKLYLIGFMGSGKSVLGKRLASQLGLKHFDLDKQLEEKYKMTIPGIFSRFDETVFRQVESERLKFFVSSDENFVLSCGGGTPCFNNNMELINSSGISIYLKLDAKTLTNRLLTSKTIRPLIKNTPGENLLEKVSEMLEVREQYYNRAQIIISGINLKVDDIIASLPKSSD